MSFPYQNESPGQRHCGQASKRGRGSCIQMLPEAVFGHWRLAHVRADQGASAATAAGLLSARNTWHRVASSSSPIAAAATPSM